MKQKRKPNGIPRAVHKLWPIINRRRGQLIDLDVAGIATLDDKMELAGLEIFADWYIDKVAPRKVSKKFTRIIAEKQK